MNGIRALVIASDLICFFYRVKMANRLSSPYKHMWMTMGLGKDTFKICHKAKGSVLAVEVWSSVFGPPASHRKLGMVAHSCNSSTGNSKIEDSRSRCPAV